MINLSHVSKNYRSGDDTVHALRDVSLEIGTGVLAAILGSSGCGKTTLLNVIGQLIKPTTGTVAIDGKLVAPRDDREAARFRNETFGYVVQDFALVEQDTVLQNVQIPLIYSRRKSGRRRDRVLAALDEFGVAELADYNVAELSGGQRQRVALARAIVNDPQIILADEPTGSLDADNKALVFGLLRRISRAGRTVVMVTHDIELADDCDAIFSLRDGVLHAAELTG